MNRSTFKVGRVLHIEHFNFSRIGNYYTVFSIRLKDNVGEELYMLLENRNPTIKEFYELAYKNLKIECSDKLPISEI
jgi:hypothetical protein